MSNRPPYCRSIKTNSFAKMSQKHGGWGQVDFQAVSFLGSLESSRRWDANYSWASPDRREGFIAPNRVRHCEAFLKLSSTSIASPTSSRRRTKEMGLDVNMTRNVGLQGSLDSIGETSWRNGSEGNTRRHISRKTDSNWWLRALRIRNRTFLIRS